MVFLALLLTLLPLSAQSTAFTYQGQLSSGGVPVTGIYDVQFTLYDAAEGGTQIGETVIVSPVAVNAGLFTAVVDLGAAAFFGRIAVRPSGEETFTLLTTRQLITPAPTALNARSADSLNGLLPAFQIGGLIPASQLSGTLPVALLPNGLGGPVTLTALQRWSEGGNENKASEKALSLAVAV